MQLNLNKGYVRNINYNESTEEDRIISLTTDMGKILLKDTGYLLHRKVIIYNENILILKSRQGAEQID